MKYGVQLQLYSKYIFITAISFITIFRGLPLVLYSVSLWNRALANLGLSTHFFRSELKCESKLFRIRIAHSAHAFVVGCSGITHPATVWLQGRLATAEMKRGRDGVSGSASFGLSINNPASCSEYSIAYQVWASVAGDNTCN